MISGIDLSPAQHLVAVAAWAIVIALGLAIVALSPSPLGRIGDAYGPTPPGCPPAGSGRRPVSPPGRRRRPLLCTLAVACLALLLAGCEDEAGPCGGRCQGALYTVSSTLVLFLLLAVAGTVGAFVRRAWLQGRGDPMARPFGDMPRRPEDRP